MHILLIEDDPRIASFVQRGLTEEGHQVDVVRTLDAAHLSLSLRPPDLLVVDRGLPDGDGIEVIEALRKRGDGIPAILLTARDAVSDRVAGLRAGADDYLVKPFAFDELLARIAAVSRRTSDTTRATAVGPLRVDLDALRAYVDDTELQLTAQEFKLLRYFVEHQGRVLSRTRLLDGVWDMTHDPGSNVVDVYVSYLRQKLSEAGAAALIHTVRGRGWVLEARDP